MRLFSFGWMSSPFLRESNEIRVSAARRATLLRAAVTAAAAALEASTNFLAEKVVQHRKVAARVLTETEDVCLRERRKVLRDGKITEEKSRYASIDRYLLLLRIMSGHEPDRNLRGGLKAACETRDELVHPKPEKRFDFLQTGGGRAASLAFVAAGVNLAKAWKGAKDVKPGRLSYVLERGEIDTWQRKNSIARSRT